MRGHIRKRGKAWAVVVYIGSENGKDRYKWYSHKTQRDAEAHLAQLLVQVQAGGGIPSGRKKVDDFLEEWLRDYAQGRVAPTTFDKYQRAVRLHIVPDLGHLPLVRLAPQAIQGWLNRELAGNLRPGSVLAYYNVLHGALTQAVRWGLLVRNPMDMVDPPRAARPEMRVWDEEQVRLFLAEAKRSSEYYPLYLTAMLTGMRQGELLGLSWQDVDLALGIAHIRRTFCRLGGRQIWKEPKSPKSRRAVALPEPVVEVLRCIREGQRRHKNILNEAYEDRGLVFCQQNGRPLHGHNIARRDFRRVAARARVPRMLDTYSHVLPGMQAEAARLVAEHLLAHD